MSLSPEEIIETICPELSGSPSLSVYLGLAVESTSQDFFGVRYNTAVAYKAAHLFTLVEGGSSTAKEISKIGGGAPVTSVSEGGLAVSFAQNSGEGSDLSSTKYGRMLQGIIRGRPKMGVNQSGGI